MNYAITQTMKNRATATRFVLAQGTHQTIKTKRWHITKKYQLIFKNPSFEVCTNWPI